MEVENRCIDIAGYLKVAILDSDPIFGDRLKVLLNILGFRSIVSMQSPTGFSCLADTAGFDLVFIEIAEDFDEVWTGIKRIRDRGVLIVGVSEDRGGRDWLWAVRRGADSILLKPYYPHLLREMLLHLVESEAARRCRLVQLPTRRR